MLWPLWAKLVVDYYPPAKQENQLFVQPCFNLSAHIQMIPLPDQNPFGSHVMVKTLDSGA